MDYCGILKHLRKALATFAGTRPGNVDPVIDPARPDEELLDDLAEAIALVRAFLNEDGAPLDDVIRKSGFERNAAIVACKEAANENDVTRKRFEVMCREVFRKFKACINVQGVNNHRADRDAINIVYKSLQEDREQADISGIIRQLHKVVDEVIETTVGRVDEDRPYDISQIDFERLKREFERSPSKKSTGSESKAGCGTTATTSPEPKSVAHRFSAALRGNRGSLQSREGSGDDRANLRGIDQAGAGIG